MQQYFEDVRPHNAATRAAVDAMLRPIHQVHDLDIRGAILTAWRTLADATDRERLAAGDAALHAIERAHSAARAAYRVVAP